MTLSGRRPWKDDMLVEISSQGYESHDGLLDDPPKAHLEYQDLVYSSLQYTDTALNNTHASQIDNMTPREALICSSSFSLQCASDLPSSTSGSSCPCFDISEQAGRTTELETPLQEQSLPPNIATRNPPSPDITKADVNIKRADQGGNDSPCAMYYEGALSMLKKKRMRKIEVYGTAEGERCVAKNLMRQKETQESRKRFLSASRRRQELEVSFSRL
jgi:hypothetical protein